MPLRGLTVVAVPVMLAKDLVERAERVRRYGTGGKVATVGQNQGRRRANQVMLERVAR